MQAAIASNFLQGFSMPRRYPTPYIASYDEQTEQEQVRGERNLLIAMLHQALNDLKFGGELRRDAIRWVMSQKATRFSFLWVCTHLQYDEIFVDTWRDMCKKGDVKISMMRYTG